MSYAIVVDSCCDLTAAHFSQGPFSRVPLTISVGGEDIVDDHTFDQGRLIMLMRENEQAPKTACPSPGQYMDAFAATGAEDIYVVTLSALLSGSHNCAEQARRLWLEAHPDAHVHVFNSCSAAAGEVAVALRIQQAAETGAGFDAVVRQVEDFIASMTTYFVLENLDHLRKNGRLTGALAVVTEALHIKLLMGATPEGQIKRVGQALSVKQALSRMVALMAADPDHQGKTLYVVHCNHLERAMYVRRLAQQRCQFQDIVVTDAWGVSTVYANDGGIVVAF